MKYSISEAPLRLREYGRNIQSLVEYMKTIEDRELRTETAHEIVRIMSNLNPSLREIPDYKQKLWDHIYMIAEYDLDVETSFNMPEKPDPEEKRMQRLGYPKGKPRYRRYGWNVQLMIDEATKMEDGPIKKEYINIIANTMKMFLRNMDRESTPESVLAEHIRDLSDGKLEVRGEELIIYKAPPSHHHHQQKNQKNNRNNNKRNRKNKRHRRNY
ncbi:MAG: DUF4290 domain-containing protein [Bacteroidia bacterium]|nr:DUF4290 domain-containing protein [Bacteroidia bacterium]